MQKDLVYLIRGQVAGNSRAYVANLLLKLQDGRTHAEKVLVSSKGYIQELVRTPLAIKTLNLVDASQTGLVDVRQLLAHPLGRLEFGARRLWRVVVALLKEPSIRRKRAGLSWKSAMRDMDEAYEAACRLRANVRKGQYEQWFQEFYEISAADRRAMVKVSAAWQDMPFFSIAIIGSGGIDASNIKATLSSLKKQTYSHFDVSQYETVSDWVAKLGEGRAVGRWRLVLRAGTTLAAQTLFCLADAIVRNPTAKVIYADHDEIGEEGGLHEPFFKPDWSLEMLRSTNYIGESFAWYSAVADDLTDEDAKGGYPDLLHCLLLNLSARENSVVHIPAPLWHLAPSNPNPLACQVNTCAEVVARHFKRIGLDAQVTAIDPARCRVHYPVATANSVVSIIIPTRDKVDYLRRCVSSILKMTRFQNYEILIVDNRSVRSETRRYFRELATDSRIRILTFNEPFNYSRMNNQAVEHARGDILCLLNNDTEVISADWLDEMIGQLLQDDVGVVGAKLLFADGTVQHGGDTVGPGGCADHLHTGIGRDDAGYGGRALVAQDLSAVTAACLLTKKSLYQSLGGLNERRLKVAFNDVDYCLRVRALGKRVIWTPHALLYHHESISRGKDVSRQQNRRARNEVAYMRKRWTGIMSNDPFYNPNLNYLQPDFALSATPNVFRPWTDRPSAISAHRFSN